VNGVDSCYTGTNPNKTASVIVSINSSSYTIGSGAAAPAVSVTNQTPEATVTCTLSPTNGGFTAAPASVTNSGTFTLSTPATAGTYSFTPTCTTQTPGYSTAVSVSGNTAFTVVSGGPPPNGGCSSTQTSTPLGGKTFQRQCNGTVTLFPSRVGYGGALTDLGAVLGNKSFPNYLYSGQAPTMLIDSGYYVALAFTPAATGLIKFTANNSYGDGGAISLSTMPGGLTAGAPGVICAVAYGGLNSLIATTTAGASCQVTVGQTYYINFADTNSNGDNLCFGGATGSCSQSPVSYSFTARAL